MRALGFRNRVRTVLCIAAVAIVAALPTQLPAAILLFDAFLDGLQETPPNASPASGDVQVLLNDITGAVTVTSGTYQNLLGPSTAVHIHGPAPAGVAAAVLIGLTLDAPGSTTGTVSGGGVLSSPNITNMINGLTYVNIHSQVFPGGEIRGQLHQIPEPSTLLLAALGGFALMAYGWRRLVQARA